MEPLASEFRTPKRDFAAWWVSSLWQVMHPDADTARPRIKQLEGVVISY
jgi:hypothetical protein